ncbi:hypothetical protein H9P43_003005 [Blastocladiella emersonii ATCC 22665]|nr:hypothetical protein H9P43_003005 [Blastocladiella emersonii ATCC 22665]
MNPTHRPLAAWPAGLAVAAAVAIAAIAVLVQPAAAQDPCAALCKTSAWKSDLCYPTNQTNTCFFQRFRQCGETANSTLASLCFTGPVNETCVTTSINTCSPIAKAAPSCGNYLCEGACVRCSSLGEELSCPKDCAFYSDYVGMVEGDEVYSRCPALDPLERAVVFTFDDGPTQYTASLLAKLKATNVTATFFVVGSNLDQYSGLLKDMEAQGHIVGSHTYSHYNISRSSQTMILEDIASFDLDFETVAGWKPRFLRPPYGSITTLSSEIYRNYSMDAIMWNVDSFDYDHLKDPENSVAIVDAVLRNNPGHPHFIYLGHDTSKVAVDTFPTMIDLFKSRGFKVRSLDECIYGVRGRAVYSATRNIKPMPVQRMVLPQGSDDTVSGTARAIATTWGPALVSVLVAVHLNFLF